MHSTPSFTHVGKSGTSLGLLNFFKTFSCHRHRFLIMKKYRATLHLGEMDRDLVAYRKDLVADPDSEK